MKKTLAVLITGILCLSTFSMLVPIGKASGGVQLTDNPYGGAFHPDWSPDGSKVVFYQYDSTRWNRHIWTIDLATKVATQLTFGSVVHGMPQYSPDGSRIIFSWWGFRGDYSDFAIMNSDGSGLQSIPYNPPDYPVSGIDYIHPKFSPDGKMITFHYGVGTSWGHSTAYVATMAFDLTTLRLSQFKLLATGGQPRWSPDGAQIIYHTGYISPSPDPSQIMIMDASGSNVRAVTSGPYDYTPDMARDGEIVFVRSNSAMAERGGLVESNLYLMRRIGEEPVQLTFDSGVFNWAPVFSPDGSKIAYMSDRSGSIQIWVMQIRPKGKLVLTFDTESDAELYDQDPTDGSIGTATLDTIENIGSNLSVRGLKGTFFVQGAVFNYKVDGVKPKATDGKDFTQIIQQLHSGGYEIASHTYTHLNLTEDNNIAKLPEELQKTANEIYTAVSEWPKGFRAPYFNWGQKDPTGTVTPKLWDTLKAMGYAYDSSKWFKEENEPIRYNPYQLHGGLFEIPVAISDIPGDITKLDVWKSAIDGAQNGETRVLVFHPWNVTYYWSDFKNIINYVKEKQDNGTLQTVTAFELAASAGAKYSTSSLTVSIQSPANLYVTDPLGLHIGFDPILHTVVNEIPGATYTGAGTEPQIINITYPMLGNYAILLTGTATGNYTLTIEYITSDPTTTQTFTGIISPEEQQSFAALISETGFTSYRNAHIEIDPRSLNLGSKGTWITAYIEIAKSFDMHNINVSSILLNNTIPVAPSAPVTIGDYNNDGIPDLMVKFERQAVADLILKTCNFEGKTGTATLTVTGKLEDGTPFQGSCTITVILPSGGSGGKANTK